MMNPFTIRRYIALIMPSLLSPIMFFVGLQMYGFVYGLAGVGFSLLLTMLIGSVLLKNPFTAMLEGQGILAMNISSTGIIKPFLVQVQGAFVKGKLFGKPVNDVFDRSTVMNITPPIKNKKKAYWEDGKLKIELDEDNYNKSRFGLFQYPCLLYNDAVESFVTKDFLSESEKSVFAEHSILYVKKRLEDLTSAVRDFGRHIVEQLKPTGSLMANKWTWIIVIIMLGLLVVMFAPAVFEQVSSTGFFGQANDAIASAGGQAANSGATVSPLG